MLNYSKNDGNVLNQQEYHGIIINLSQRDKSVFNTVEIIGRKKSFSGLVTLYKIRVSPDNIDAVIKTFQHNMADWLFFKKQEFYFHFYRDNELIIVFKDKIFKVSPDKSTWGEAIAYGLQLKITAKQLDFFPSRFGDEQY
jgi:hypothetical protein